MITDQGQTLVKLRLIEEEEDRNSINNSYMISFTCQYEILAIHVIHDDV